MRNIRSKKALITGVASGIGRAIALRLAAEGVDLFLVDVDSAGLAATVSEASKSGIEVFGRQCDVGQPASVSAAVAEVLMRWGGVDILINNAGISMRSLVADVELDTIRKVMDINFWGTVYCTKFALPDIIRNKGTVVGVSSIAGYRGLPGRSGYSASKFAVNGWLEALRTELLDSGVNVMWVCPGFTTSNIRNAALNKDGNAQGESPMDEDKMMSAEECATHILHAIEKRKRTIVLTSNGKQTVFLNRFFPKIADKLVRNFFFKNGSLVK